MIDFMLMPLKRYAEFGGRSRRKEFWFFFLFYVVVSLVLGIVEGMAGLTGMVGAYGPLTAIFYLAMLIPYLAVAIRRIHDSDKSGWFILVPIYNLILLFLEGTKGPNRFGPDPKGEGSA